MLRNDPLRLFVLCILLLLHLGHSNIISIPLKGGAEQGEYVVEVNVGTPPKPFSVVIDTGMPALYLPSYKCPSTDCPSVYTPSNSNTSIEVPCNKTICICNAKDHGCGYREQFRNNFTFSGTINIDTINFFNYYLHNFSFVTFAKDEDDRLPSLGDNTDGVLGLSPWPTHYPALNLLQQMTSMSTPTFSLCLGEFEGQMTLGGYNETYVGSEIAWVPIVSKSNFTLELANIKVGHQFVWNETEVNFTLATIESGRQSLVLPTSVFEEMRLLFRTLLCRSTGNKGLASICDDGGFFDGKCFILKDSLLEQFPNISLTFNGGVELVIPPQNYFIDFAGHSCLGITSKPNIKSVVIGNRIMQEYYTIFESSRVGFAKAVNCSGELYRMEVISGNEQNGEVGKRLAKPLIVKVTRIDGNPVEGINVTFNADNTTPPAAEVMWIAHAIWNNTPARVEPQVAVTKADGTAMTYLWLSGAAEQNTVIVDVPLCLNHVVFKATGHQSYVWSLLTYLCLAGLATSVIFLNYWYSKAVQRRKIQRFNSSLQLSTQFAYEEPEDNNSDPLSSPPMSPSLSPPPNLGKNEDSDSEGDNEIDQDNEPQRRYHFMLGRPLWNLQKKVQSFIKKKVYKK